jgi:hypothetical protein
MKARLSHRRSRYHVLESELSATSGSRPTYSGAEGAWVGTCGHWTPAGSSIGEPNLHTLSKSDIIDRLDMFEAS